MNINKTGGPAFPVNCVEDEDAPGCFHGGYTGMTLRDYFAAKAMPLAMKRLGENYEKDLVANHWCWEDGDWESVAEISYALADAMIKSREA